HADYLSDLPATALLWLSDKAVPVPVIPREALSPNAPIPAPALIVQPDSTLLIEPGWQVQLDKRTGALVGRRMSA
ncbi:MAG: hypothetical protein ACK4RG_04065, partial [Fimbriimonadales bacterium]